MYSVITVETVCPFVLRETYIGSGSSQVISRNEFVKSHSCSRHGTVRVDIKGVAARGTERER